MKNKKAISLIVLIITIIVMIILASAIIMSLDNANIFNKAEEAVNKTNEKTNKYLSEIKFAERELEKIQGPSKVTDTTPGNLSGKGTTEEPYLIESIEDLVAFSNRVNGGETFDGMTVKLTRLLDFNSDNSYVNPTENNFGDVNEDGNTEDTLKQELSTGKGFTPIGIGISPTQTFKGIFDGDGAEIRNLYINNDELSYAGLFGYAEDAEIRNLGVMGNITAINADLGAIVGWMMKTDGLPKIENCYSKGNYTGFNIGGIVGTQTTMRQKTEELSMLQDCYNEATLTVKDGGYIAGIVSSGDYVHMNRCYNKGDLKSQGEDIIVGGLFTELWNSKIQNSYNIGNILMGAEALGGGIAYRCEYTVIENVYNAGKLGDLASFGSGTLMSTLAYESKINNAYNIGESKTIDYVIEYLGLNFDVSNIYYISSGLKDFSKTEYSEEAATEMNISDMKTQAFVDTLNENIKDRPDLIKWKLGPNGYPTLDI